MLYYIFKNFNRNVIYLSVYWMKRKESLGQSYVKPDFFGACRVPEALQETKK